jgi:hypothetical protein
MVFSTNRLAANGVLSAVAKAAAVFAPTTIRLWSSDVWTARPAAPRASPTSISGPSRPIESPPAIATHKMHDDGRLDLPRLLLSQHAAEVMH